MSHTSDFKNSPAAFLEKKVVMVPPEVDKDVGDKPGRYDFTIEHLTGNTYFLARAGKDSGSDIISAYYLPWETLKATSMDLADEADFFFTSEMTNCRFTVLVDDPKKPKVSHIAGTLTKTGRNSGEEAVFGKDKRVRRLSISGSFGANAHAYAGQDVAEAARSSAFVFGQRGAEGWKFHAQIAKGVLSCKTSVTDDMQVLGYVDVLNHKKTDKVSGKA